MTKAEREQLAARYVAISDELVAIAEARGADRPSLAELALRAEQDAIEYRLASERDN